MYRLPRTIPTAITGGRESSGSVIFGMFLHFSVEKKNDFGIFSPVEIGERMN